MLVEQPGIHPWLAYINRATGGKDVRAYVTDTVERGPHRKRELHVVTEDLTVYEFSMLPGSKRPTFERRRTRGAERDTTKRRLPDVVRDVVSYHPRG